MSWSIVLCYAYQCFHHAIKFILTSALHMNILDCKSIGPHPLRPPDAKRSEPGACDPAQSQNQAGIKGEKIFRISKCNLNMTSLVASSLPALLSPLKYFNWLSQHTLSRVAH